MKNILLAHATITRQHSGGAQFWRALMLPASTNAQYWREAPASTNKSISICAGRCLMSSASTVPLQNQQSLFKAVKHCQIKKF
jgi:hypothetical protein